MHEANTYSGHECEVMGPMPAMIGGKLLQFQAKLGSGGFGEVWRALLGAEGQEVAVKILPYDESKPMPKEVRLMERFSGHPNLVELRGTGVVNNLLLIAMSSYNGGSLYEWRSEETKPHEAATIIGQAAAGLEHIHSFGWVHRDIKPENILIGASDDALGLRVRIADLGIAVEEYIQGKPLQDVYGTPGYMSIEQCEGKAKRYSDQYALAVLAYELVIARYPFDDGAVPPEWVENAAKTILKALSSKEAQRYPSVMGFAHAFEMAIYEGLPEDKRVTMPEAARKSEARVHIQEGRFAYEQGEYVDALTTLEQAALLDPQNISAQHYKALTLRALNRRDEAATLFRTICDLSERTEDDFVLKGWAHKELGEYIYALGYFNKAEEWGYRAETLHFYRAHAYEGAGDLLQQHGRVAEAHRLYCSAKGYYLALEGLYMENPNAQEEVQDMLKGLSNKISYMASIANRDDNGLVGAR